MPARCAGWAPCAHRLTVSVQRPSPGGWRATVPMHERARVDAVPWRPRAGGPEHKILCSQGHERTYTDTPTCGEWRVALARDQPCVPLARVSGRMRRWLRPFAPLFVATLSAQSPQGGPSPHGLLLLCRSWRPHLLRRAGYGALPAPLAAAITWAHGPRARVCGIRPRGAAASHTARSPRSLHA
jgi:hypothetical protein